MLLYSHRINLHRHQYQIDEEENQIHLEYVLLIEREVKRQWIRWRLIRIAVHQSDVIVDGEVIKIRMNTCLIRIGAIVSIEFTRIEMMPGTCGRIAIARNQRNIPKSVRIKRNKERRTRKINFSFLLGTEWVARFHSFAFRTHVDGEHGKLVLQHQIFIMPLNENKQIAPIALHDIDYCRRNMYTQSKCSKVKVAKRFIRMLSGRDSYLGTCFNSNVELKTFRVTIANDFSRVLEWAKHSHQTPNYQMNEATLLGLCLQHQRYLTCFFLISIAMYCCCNCVHRCLNHRHNTDTGTLTIRHRHLPRLIHIADHISKLISRHNIVWCIFIVAQSTRLARYPS